MKRISAVLLSILLIILICPAHVFADVIFIPQDDFYTSHQMDCEYIDRQFTANGPDGVVTVYKSPESDKVICQIPNQEILYISFVYTAEDDIQWGYWEDYQIEKSGWIPMAYLNLVYDSISFREDYGSQFTVTEGNVSEDYAGQELRFWNYPGSETYIAFTANQGNMPGYYQTYTDSTGLLWGNVSYYMGLRDCWICLDHPTADFETLYPVAPPNHQDTASDNAPTQPAPDVVIVPKQNEKLQLITIIGVALVATTTALILIKLRKKA